MAVIDGEGRAIFYVDPDEATLAAYREKLRSRNRRESSSRSSRARKM